jgi:hypothetical protein
MNLKIQAPFALLLIALLAATSNAHAQASPKQQARQMDTNVDGTLSADEQEAAVEWTFKSLDTDEDSFLSADELDTDDQSSTERMDALDIDNDGRVSETEHAAGAKARFKDADASNDGNLDADEIKTADDAAKPVTPVPE